MKANKCHFLNPQLGILSVLLCDGRTLCQLGARGFLPVFWRNLLSSHLHGD